ncbi:hypothetical protein EVAR_3176_1 [Eumeta japonica]|uniref:Uncharacterized protein n=1 Tax=Eumeta variegata TaxID=151549 RepID=A0A4C1XIZ2_EUMVA|nr:hypothetical protein EVAR_3176_1 [Eumeta japonica]
MALSTSVLQSSRSICGGQVDRRHSEKNRLRCDRKEEHVGSARWFPNTIGKPTVGVRRSEVSLRCEKNETRGGRRMGGGGVSPHDTRNGNHAAPKRGRVRHDTRKVSKNYSLASIPDVRAAFTAAGRRSSHPLDIECCKVLDLFAEDRRKPNTTMRRREKEEHVLQRT